MNSENNTHHHSVSERCVICGRSIEPGHGALRINHHGNTVNLCNPDCLRIFAQEPDSYLARLAKRIREQQLQESLKTENQESGQDEGFHPEVAYQVHCNKSHGHSALCSANEEASYKHRSKVTSQTKLSEP